MDDSSSIAAIDLGSNSFRLEIGRVAHGQIERVEYLKEMVRLGGGLDVDSRLSAASMQRGWDCLARFAERVRGFDVVKEAAMEQAATARATLLAEFAAAPLAAAAGVVVHEPG